MQMHNKIPYDKILFLSNVIKFIVKTKSKLPKAKADGIKAENSKSKSNSKS